MSIYLRVFGCIERRGSALQGASQVRFDRLRFRDACIGIRHRKACAIVRASLTAEARSRAAIHDHLAFKSCLPWRQTTCVSSASVDRCATHPRAPA